MWGKRQQNISAQLPARCSFLSSIICCPSASSLIPGSQHRPADVYLPCGRPATLDITVISTMQPSTIQPAADNQGHALLVAETRKFATHGPACQAAGISFIPLTIETMGGLSDATAETMGGLSDATAETISGIGRLIGQRFGVSPHESSRHLFQRLAICLWKGNATAWIITEAHWGRAHFQIYFFQTKSLPNCITTKFHR